MQYGYQPNPVAPVQRSQETLRLQTGLQEEDIEEKGSPNQLTKTGKIVRALKSPEQGYFLLYEVVTQFPTTSSIVEIKFRFGRAAPLFALKLSHQF